jgi:hypothetical protein
LKEVFPTPLSRTFKEKEKNSRKEFSYLCMGKDISVPKHCYRELRGTLPTPLHEIRVAPGFAFTSPYPFSFGLPNENARSESFPLRANMSEARA